jgi:D-alanyl-D-alanine carboxypeptidase (penicillin-binding protein 5/6)
VTAVARLAAAAVCTLAGIAVLAAPAPASAAEPDCPSDVHAASAIVIEVSTGAVACSRSADDRRPIASTTKLMTALLTLERAKLSDVFTAAHYFPPPIESQIGLNPGERMTVRDLMRGLLVESANDAAVTLAEGVGGTRKAFVKAMNRRAQQLGLKDTHYANPIGLDDPANYSTARNLVTLAARLRGNPFFRTTVDRPRVTLSSGEHPRTFDNRNDLVARYHWVNGVKSGHTAQAGYVLVGSGDSPKRKIEVVSAVLGEPSVAARDQDTLALLRFGLSRFQRVTALRRGEVLARVPIRYRQGAELALVAAHTIRRIVPHGRRGDVTTHVVGVPADVTGPVAAGQPFGAVEIRYKGKTVARVGMVAGASVPAADFAARAKSWFTGPLAVILVFAALAGTFLLAVWLRRFVRDARRPRGRDGGKARPA